MSHERGDPAAPLLVRAWAHLLVVLSPLIVLACVAGAVAAVVYLPSVEDQPAAPITGLLPHNSRAVAAERDVYRLFRLPLLTPWLVVQRDARGLSRRAQEHAFRLAIASTRRRNPGLGPIFAAAPFTNARRDFPAARERRTTTVTYLYMAPHTDLANGSKYADRYASILRRDGGFVGFTGPLAARMEQYQIISDKLHIVEAATLALILLIVGIAFRAVGAPLLTAATAGLAFVSAEHILGWIGEHSTMTMPRDLTPVAVALMLGIVTDYSIFFLAGARERLATGASRADAVRAAVRSVTPIVLAAGLLVALGVASLAVGTLGFFRSFGPGMAVIVVTGLVMSVVFVPACLVVFGRLVFWPSLRRPRQQPRARMGRAIRWLTAKPVAAVVVVMVAAGLAVAALPATKLGLGLALIRALPANDPVRESADEAARGFAAGIVAPTEILVRKDGIAANKRALARLEGEIRRQPHVASVLGPADEASARAVAARGIGPRRADRPLRVRGRDVGVFVEPKGNAVRFAVILDNDPMDAPAIAALRRLTGEMPQLLRRAGLPGAEVLYAGQTAVAEEAVDAVKTSMWRIALVALAVNVVLLMIFLRAAIAPLYLVAASALALLATFGLTTLFFQNVLGYAGMDYFLPVAAGVLLVSLGSDYNLFVVGRIWQESARRPLRDAVRVASPSAGRTISVAGFAMASSFALLALIPLSFFRVLAFAMAFGILVDALIVRSLLVPGLIVLVGRRGFWPRQPAYESVVRPSKARERAATATLETQQAESLQR